MDETLREAHSADNWRTALAADVQDQRQRARELLDARQQKLRELESRIAGQIDAALQAIGGQDRELVEVRSVAQSRSAALDQRQQDLDFRQQDLLAREQAVEANRREADRRHQQLLDDIRQKLTDLDKRLADAAEEAQRLQVREAALGRRELELNSQAADLQTRQAALAATSDQLQRGRGELDATRAAQQAEFDQLRSDQAELRRLQAELSLAQQSLASREHETQRQRRQIAQQLRARKQELTAEIELHRAEALASGSGQDMQLQVRLSEMQGKYERLREDFERREQQRDEATHRLAEAKGVQSAHEREIAEQKLALDEAQRKRMELEGARRDLENKLKELQKNQSGAHDAHIKSLEQQIEELRKAQAASQNQWNAQRQALEAELAAAKKQPKGGDPAEVTKLREENKQLEAWLAEAEEKARQSGGGSNQDLDDLRARFEMAVQDVRELKNKNAELSNQLAKAKQSGGAAAADAGGGSDWESMKRKMLAQLETDFEAEEPQAKADKMTVEGAIKITDRVVAEKEEEIQELKRLLDSQAQNVGQMAVGAAAIAQVLDTDDLIRQERESLQKMQEALREQLKKAEVDISLERAKLARERSSLDEKLRTIESDRAQGGSEGGAGDKGKKGPARGKWLARLGLQGGKEE